MKVGILAGGLGARLAEETETKPKPMVEVGGRPILWHIMMHYRAFGHKDFVIALGYKSEYIKKYMIDYCQLNSSLRVDMANGAVHVTDGFKSDWCVDLVDTGRDTQTGGRIKQLIPHMGNETFMLTWGDGVSNIDLHALLHFHRSHGKLATLTAVRPPARFGHLEMDGDHVVEFSEKVQTKEGWINGAFFVLEPGVEDYIDGHDTQWEKEPLERLASDGQLLAYRHHDFWQCMDNLRDKRRLDSLWQAGNPPWKTWEG
ncbi:glucose-1-phosphate cytidylyltransferase [Lamprobacter modestohalophilus]|uniref:Glucose-1-phosphate cytidylyltransferase n=1 Tax=Lamprobacter modestohalophilus TaxID=1064514 RepID=A0A9X0WD45_9GAMM|nr:glucose-1-phosphate cytidylyltransferase [Lamprobacter modestohalophilus]MBK1621216.1 glucose-1-phosphate cytidylyltransferase [Lamprobacter modestohalophilus]MCF7977444.1 glucose-1-phosphate cytidylyltransferase [Chromatiaceae bacterium]MCF7995568.1 glucose-1-phosphate cytidylyltransferase [Chromatiaceae bacterium]MCF8015856.1 glucose-1-phosphate cytidylyltransferase [Chromatiaceae bacterium]